MTTQSRMRAKRKRLQVTFPSGDTICFANVTATFIETLNRIGAEHFPAIPLELSHLPLLSREEYPQLKGYMKPVCEGWFVNTQSDTEQKYLQLRAINDLLNLGLSLILSEDLEISGKPSKEPKKKHKEKLHVTFPDGETIFARSSGECFLACLRKIGISTLAHKRIEWNGHSLFSPTKTPSHDIQIDDTWWISSRSSTKDRARLLRVIAIHTQLTLDIKIISPPSL